MTSEEKHLIAICHSMLSALNTANFDPDTYPWTSLSEDFLADVEYRDPPGTLQIKYDIVSKREYLTLAERIAQANPEWRYEVVDVHVDINYKARRATMYTNLTLRMSVGGATRSILNVGELEKRDGTWLLVRMKGERGMDVCR